MGSNHVKFADMWALIQKNHTDQSVFTAELVTAIFWEETAFRNIQNTSSHAAGFGQVTPGTMKLLANAKYVPKAYTVPEILASDDLSVSVASQALKAARDWKKKKDAALEVYAGAPNLRVIPRWKNCETALIGLKLPKSLTTIDNDLKSKIKAALSYCTNGGYDPELVF